MQILNYKREKIEKIVKPPPLGRPFGHFMHTHTRHTNSLKLSQAQARNQEEIKKKEEEGRISSLNIFYKSSLSRAFVPF